MDTPERIFLIGPMGAGKSSVARRLAGRLDWEALDTDAEIQARTGVDIGFIFEKEGEEGFRVRERAVLEDFCQREACVIATGGGLVLDPDNRELLRSNGYVVFLNAGLDTQMARTRITQHRPALEGTDKETVLREMLESRLPLYHETAHWTVETDGQRVQQVASRIYEHLGSLGLS